MITLSLDTTAAVASCALVRDGVLLAEYTINSGNTHSQTLLPMIKNMLETLRFTPGEIDIYALSAGPGSFTGVRIGAATIKGLAFAEDKPSVAVSSLEAMAENLKITNGIICPAMNARRNQVYTAIFESKDGKIKRLTDDMAIPVAQLEEMLSDYENVWFTGDGYDLVSYISTNETPPRLRLQSAAAVAAVGERIYMSADDKSIFTAAALMPVYLRKPQAEREREEKLKKEGK